MLKSDEQIIEDLRRINANQRDGYVQLEKILGLEEDEDRSIEELLRLVKERIVK